MPRMKTIKPALQEEIEKDLMKFCNGARYVCIQKFADYYGIKRTKATEWLNGLPFVREKGKRKERRVYRVADIAEKIYLNTEV